ncbi:hypothetical protein [Halorhodospira halochloris]|uniref:IS66 family transposase n=1 Tax=Halorhodospira halochloris TaxID=1052 RepID=UPI003B75B4B5
MVEDLRGQLAWYQEQHRLAKAKRFAHSQAVPPEQQNLGRFDEAEQQVHREKASPVRAHKRKAKQGGGRAPLPDHLPRREIVHELDAHARQCACGCERHVIGEEVAPPACWCIRIVAASTAPGRIAGCSVTMG